MKHDTPHPNTVITCHRNADFDAVASMIAASILYPHSILVFPGTQERELQKLFDDTLRPLYPFQTMREIDLAAITQLVVVDTSQADRLAHVAGLLHSEQVDLHIWDHHPGKPDLPRVRWQYLEHVGSTSTLFTEEIQRRGLPLGCENASLIGLGIYGDTGSFSFHTATPRDFQAAAFLLGQGMDVSFIASMMRYKLSREQLRVLNELLDSAELHEVGGATLVIATTHLDAYLNDFAILASRFGDFQPFDIFFGLGAMGDKVQVVARSKLPQVDVGLICKKLGGGGHASAASAAVRDRTVPEVKDYVLSQFSIRANQDKNAARLMSSPAVGVEAQSSLLEAEKIMARYGLKALPVFRNGTRQCAGWMDHQLTVRAIRHGLGEVSVAAYMQHNFSVVSAGDNLQTLMDIIIGQRQRLVPVVEGPNLPERFRDALEDLSPVEEETRELRLAEMKTRPVIGVVTRTDLIRTFTDDANTQLPKPRQSSQNKRNLKKTMQVRLAPQACYLLELAGRLGDREGLNVYVVGGFVRDLLMAQKGRVWPDIDIDLVVEGNALAFAETLAQALHGRVSAHKEFMTAVVLYPPGSVDKKGQSLTEDGLGNMEPPKRKTGKSETSENTLRVDVASTRLEYYSSPAALPTVELSSLKMDLYRRDFTINAMAVQLNPEQFGVLLDFFDGQIDIKQKRIRMLHALSFVDDPTRALRAIRFEQRYLFRIGPQADRLIRDSIDLKLIDKLSGKRVVHELMLMLQEKNPMACFVRMQEFNMLVAIHPQLDLPPWKQEMLEKILRVIAWHKHLYLNEEPDLLFMFLLAVCRNASTPHLQEVLDRLDFLPNRRESMLALRFQLIDTLSATNNWQNENGHPSQLHEILRDLPLEGLLYLVARVEDEDLHRELTHYIYEGRKQKPDIDGKDLAGMGLSPGPIYKYILDRVLAAKLDGLANSREEQYTLAASLALQWDTEQNGRLEAKQRGKLTRLPPIN